MTTYINYRQKEIDSAIECFFWFILAIEEFFSRFFRSYIIFKYSHTYQISICIHNSSIFTFNDKKRWTRLAAGSDKVYQLIGRGTIINYSWLSTILVYVDLTCYFLVLKLIYKCTCFF